MSIFYKALYRLNFMYGKSLVENFQKIRLSIPDGRGGCKSVEFSTDEDSDEDRRAPAPVYKQKRVRDLWS